ncbi:MAG TPA: BCD family MFS transporter [Bradyrhizobium sp.]|jgi:BCD family chlorophyll transporter-like MFS transporter|nr:BCD family MFS transporter [Bradyrhizobium sp.]
MQDPPQTLSWFGIVRLGLVQTALGSVTVLTMATLNRVMVVELALPSMLPGLLVGLHYAMQLLRPRLGYGSDLGGRRTPWIIGGMLLHAAGGALAAVATALMATQLALGIALAVIAFIMIGIGVSAAGTSLLVLLAKRTDPSRRSAAASIAWTMMVTGFIATTAAAGHALDPFSGARLIAVSSAVSVIAVILTLVGVWNIEGKNASSGEQTTAAPPKSSFREELAEIWRERQARRFAIFIFISMLAYSAPDLILEPFAGAVFGMTPGETTKLAGFQHTGTMIGMILLPVLHRLIPAWRTRTTPWIVGGCIACAFGLLNIAAAAAVGPPWPLRASFVVMGITSGIYSIAAIGAMMNLVGAGHRNREGTRMGLWGASQAISYATGGFLGTLASDAARYLLPSVSLSYALVFAAEAGLFIVAAGMALWIGKPAAFNQAVEEAPWVAKQEA